MKLNWAERLVVNNPQRAFEQRMLIRWMKKAMPIPSGGSILEIGCGRGAGACSVANAFQPAVLHAMDLDFRMIQKATRYIPSYQKSKISLYVADTIHLPHKDAAFDAVFGFGVLHHVPDWRSALDEVARVLKEGGVYFIEELYPSLYQNFITKHILLHPEEDRFMGKDLREALECAKLPLRKILELPKVGMIGVSQKTV